MPRSGVSRPLFVAIDLGSSGVRAGVARATGRLLGVARRPLPGFRPSGGPDLAREFEPASLKREVGAAVRAALRAARVPGRGIVAVSVTSQREAIAMLDSAGTTLYVGPNNDLRGAFQGAAIDDNHATLIWETTGHLPTFMLAWSKLAWFRDEAPETYRQIARVTSLADWLVHELTGELHLERTLGVEAGLVNVTTGAAAEELSAALGFERVRLPGLVEPGSVVGLTRPAQASALGLPGGVPAVIAGPDTQAGLVGLGVGATGDVGVLAGWSGSAQMVTDGPVFDPDRGLWTGRHVIGRRYVLEGNAGVMGGAYEWLVRLVSGGRMREPDFAAVDRAARRKDPGAGAVSAHLGPDLVNMSRSSLRPGGILFPVPLAVDPPDAGALGRAAIENFAFAIRANLERLDALSSVGHLPARHVAVGGGMVRSRAFRDVLAAVIGRSVRVGSPDASLLGAVTLAACATGEGRGIEPALRLRARSCLSSAGDPAATADYDGHYEEWRHRGDLLAQAGL